MTKSVPPFFPTGLIGGMSLFLLVLPVGAFAQQPTPANVESSTVDESKSDESGAGGDTEILASQGATFAAKDRIAVFNGDVRVRDPRFTIACAKLTVFLAKGAVPGGEPSSTRAPTATPPPIAADPKGKENERPGGIDHALAEGGVIIIQKRAPTKPGEEEKVTIARAESAEYDNKTGDMTLRGMPKIEQSGNSTEALSNSTWMVIHRDNSIDIHGPNRSHLIQRGKNAETPGPRPSSSPAANKRPQS